MKTFIISADAQGRQDGFTKTQLWDNLPNQVYSELEADVVIVLVSLFIDYKFNPKLLGIKKPVVLVDYLELEWCYFDQWNDTHLFGVNSRECTWLNHNIEWIKLCDWIKDHPPVVYFKRELLQKDSCSTIKPIDWPCALPATKLDTEQQFNARPIEVFYNWGFSNPSRVDLHADIFRAMNTHNIGVISQWDQFDKYFDFKGPRTWVSIFSPHYTRQPMETILKWQSRSKLSVSMPGAGGKCFRSSEMVNTIMALPWDNLAWSFPWEHCVNCLRLGAGSTFETLECAIKQCNNLYEQYVCGQENLDKYRSHNYISNYIVPLIQEKL